MIVRKTLAALPLHGIVDLEAEKSGWPRKSPADGRCGQDRSETQQRRFRRRAPEEVVEENRERLAEAFSRVEKLEAARARLSGL